MPVCPLWKALDDVVFPDGLLTSYGERPWLSEMLSTYNLIKQISSADSNLRTDFVKLLNPHNINFAKIAYLVIMLCLQFPGQKGI